MSDSNPDPKQKLRYPQVLAEEGLDDWRFFLVKLPVLNRACSFTRKNRQSSRPSSASTCG